MNRSRNLLRDYGLALGLVLTSVLLFWKTMLPQLARNRSLDEALQDVREDRGQSDQELRRLKALEEADWDPLVVERMAREIFLDLGLPPEEVMVSDVEPVEGS